MARTLYDVRTYIALGQTPNQAFASANTDALANNGDVYVSAGPVVNINDTVLIGTSTALQGSGGFTNTTLVGDGHLSSVINYTGPQDGRPAVQLSGGSKAESYGYTVKDSRADGGQQAWGTSGGLMLASPWSSGTGTTGVRLRDVGVAGFYRGIELGDRTGTRNASEVQVINCVVQYCDTGIRQNGYNTLNITYQGTDFAICRVGLDCGECSQTNILSASGAGNDVTVFANTGGTLAVWNLRDEQSRWTVWTSANAPILLSMRNCVINPPTSSDGVAVAFGGTGQTIVELHSCYIYGFLGIYSAQSVSLDVQNSFFRGTLPYPFQFAVGGAGAPYNSSLGTRYLSLNNYQMGANLGPTGTYFTDIQGVYLGASTTPSAYQILTGAPAGSVLLSGNPAVAVVNTPWARVYVGDDIPIAVSVSGYDITGWTLRARFWRQDGTGSVQTCAVTLSNPTQGAGTAALTSTQTTALGAGTVFGVLERTDAGNATTLGEITFTLRHKP